MIPTSPAELAELPSETSIQWEETPCLLCGRDESDLIAEAADPLPKTGQGLRFAVVRCRECGLAYTNPRPTAGSIAQFYPSDYVPHEHGEDGRSRLPSRLSLRFFGRPCAERRGHLPWSGTGRLLDFGCGGGGFLRRMASLGWRVTGLDISPRVFDSIRQQSGIAILLGSLPHRELDTGSFEVITMWQSLEHVHRPLPVLRAAYQLLVPGGKLVIAVPNIASYSARRFGEHWLGYDLPRHLTHFAPDTLSAMLRAAGLRVESVRGWVHAEWLRKSAGRACAAGEVGLANLLMSAKPIARAAAWAGYAARGADCLVAVAARPE